MKSNSSIDLAKTIRILLFIQVLCCFLYIGNHVLFNSSFKLWLSPEYLSFQKVQMMLGGDYRFAQSVLGSLPDDSNILIVTKMDYWFINYYMLPKKLFTHPDVREESDLRKLPKSFLKDKNINYVLLYNAPAAKLLQVSGGKIK